MNRFISLTFLCGLLSSAAFAQNPAINLDPELLRKTPKTPSLRTITPLWGWADLHAHPASHLSFGADAEGNNGIFWGKPGLNLEASRATLLSDLPPCSPDKHGSFDSDVVRHLTHQTVIGSIDKITVFNHQSHGAGSFSNWPSARSLTHQQMHITAIRRAYDGGQRLMIASVTDNQFLSSLWSKIGYNALGNQVPAVDPNFDLNSAKRQLAFIRRLVAANPIWMEIAHSAADARRIIGANKLALILSLEMDSLTSAQTLRLVSEDGVRQIIPIHLINNTQGGCAVYGDAFNTANAFVNSTRQTGNWNNLGNDAFYRVIYDPLLRGRLGRPQTLVAEGNNLVQGGAIWPREVSDATYAALGYDAPLDRGGHRNTNGLSLEGKQLLRDLARQGLLVDIAHMSEKSASDVLDFAVRQNYPVMDSHTGLRNPDETAANERALMRRHAQQIANLGGLLGLGTEGTSGQTPIVMQPVIPQPGKELVRFTGQFRERTWQISRLEINPRVSHLTVTIRTGGDDLRGGKNRVWARVSIRRKITEVDLSKGQGWGNGSTHSATFALPSATTLNDIDTFGLRTDPTAKNGPFDDPDNWNVDELKVEATFGRLDTVGTWLEEYKDALSVMKGRGVALGTDINGFAPTLAFAADAIRYPITVAKEFGVRPAGYTPPDLARDQMGSRIFDFQKDGIAHYGLLSDFMQAVSQKPNSAAAMKALFRSANDVVEMWERCEAAKGNIR